MDQATVFIKEYLSSAEEIQKKTGLHWLAILTQAALESAWGTKAVGNMFFGVKDTDGINGNEQLITTTEYSTNPDLKFPVILSKEQVLMNGKKIWKYKVKDYFRKFDSPADSFLHHVNFIQKNKRYAKAWEVRADYNKFFEEIAKAGYATDPNYTATLKSVAKSILKRI